MRPWAFVLVGVLALACSALRGPGANDRAAGGPPGAADSVAVGDSAAAGDGLGRVSASGAPAARPVPIRTDVLENGLRVVVHRNPVVPLVTIEIDVKNGAYTLSREFEGLAHFYEHMFF